MNAVEIEAALSDLSVEPFDAEEFPYQFLAAFGNKEVALKRLRTGNNNTSDLPNGVLLRNNIHGIYCDFKCINILVLYKQRDLQSRLIFIAPTLHES
jgi:hypothetical protein